MPLAEIQEDMNVYNCPVTRETLKAPAAPEARAVIDHFIEEVYNKRPEDMAQPGFGCLEVVEYPELYEEAIATLHHLRQCQKMFAAAHFDEFGVRDIFAPSKTRFHWQISSLINFNKFRQTRLSAFEEMAKNADHLVERERVVLSEKSDFQREITAIEEARAAEEPQVAELQQAASELTVEITALHQKQLTLTDHTRDAKSSLSQKNESATALKVRIMSEREDVDAMSARVVSSPDRVKGELHDMRETLKSERDNVAGMEHRTTALVHRGSALNAAVSAVNGVQGGAEDSLNAKTKLEELEKCVAKRSKTKNELVSEVGSIKQSRAHFERLIESVGTKVARIDEQRHEIDSNSSESDRKLAERSLQLDKEQVQVMKQLDERASSARSYQKKIEDSAMDLAEEMETLRVKQDLVATNFNQSHKDISKMTALIQEHNQNFVKRYEDSLAGVGN